MYEVDEQDSVTALAGVPQASIGAPNPLVLSDEQRVVVAYYLEATPPDWDGKTARVLGPTEASEPLAMVRFSGVVAQMLGPPNDEAFSGHPLAARGLGPYRAWEVERSSWIRRLEKMNSVHPSHRQEAFMALRHIVLAFHDTTFECVCRRFDVRIGNGSIGAAVPEMVKLLEW